MSQKRKIVILRGLPGSGKTTYAKKWVLEAPDERVMIEKAMIREEEAHKHQKDSGVISRIRDARIREALAGGKSVISSDTNLSQRRVKRLSNMASDYNIPIEIVSYMDLPLGVLIERDSQSEKPVGEQTIRELFYKYIKTLPTFLEYDPALRWCVVSDIDGTLTNGPKNRSPYDLGKSGQDDINLGVAAILDSVQFVFGDRGVNDVDTILITGRSDKYREETEAWLDKNAIDYKELIMRAEGDNRVDYEVKHNIVEKHIRGKYNVLFWIEDRPRVATMLRDVFGINVLQRGDPRYDF